MFWFTLSLPLVSSRQKPHPKMSPDDDAARRILVVEDNLVNQKVARKMLSKLGLKADMAGDGQQALHALEKTSYDIILMDMQMPIMDGITATRTIRTREDEWGAPIIIAMTANAFHTDRQACLEAGMNDFLSKPVRIEDLQAKLTQWIGKGIEKKIRKTL